MSQEKTVYQYRQAAMKLYGISAEEAEACIVPASEDGGEWAPESLAIIYLEFGHTQPISYYTPGALDNCMELSDVAGTGYIEYINAAVAAVYPA